MALSINNDSLILHAQRQLAGQGDDSTRPAPRAGASARAGGVGDGRVVGVDPAHRTTPASASAVSVVATIAGGGSGHEGGYAASRYLHQKLQALGVDGGIEGITSWLSLHQDANLDVALNAVSGGVYPNVASFMADFDARGAHAGAAAAAPEPKRAEIQDPAVAAATAKLTRGQILQQAAAAIMVQANGEPKAVLALLR